MKLIRRVSLPEPDTHRAILAHRRPPDPEDLLIALSRRFDAYVVAEPFAQPFVDTPAELASQADLLHRLYDSESSEAKDVRELIKNVERVRCPYCGRPYPSTLDHILPRSVYPEFSMFARNLVPSCWDCNRAKSDRVWDEHGRRLFLNPYADAFLETEFAHVLVIPDSIHGYRVPRFDFEFNWEGCTIADRNTCQSHFEGLGIFLLLRNEFAGKLRELHRRFSSRAAHGPLTEDDVRQEVEWARFAATEEQGANCWDSLLYRGILRNRALMQFLAVEDYSNPSAVSD